MNNHREPSETEKELLSIVRGFLSEYKTARALSNIHLNASLERDLGIDSLGRVELFLRIEKAFSIQFEDAVMAEAETVNDILTALQQAKPFTPAIQQILQDTLAETHVDPLLSKTLVEVLVRRAEEDPNRPHVYLQDEHGAEEILRYGQLLENATKTANGLYELGLRSGETVAIMLPTGKEFFYAFFGVLLAGGIPVPIYPPLRADRIEEYAVREASILNNAAVKILITFDKIETLGKLLRVFIKSLNTVTKVDLLMTAKSKAPPIVIKSEYPALIQYTSGSTSDPKGVLLTHYNLLSNIRAFGNATHFTPKDIGVSWLPLYHDMGLIGAWLGSLYHAYPITILSPLSFLNRPERWLWAIHYHRATLSGGPNFAYELCVRKIDESKIVGLDLSSWRLAFNGAEAINPKTLERFIKKFAPYGFKAETLYPVYGLAENAVALTFPPLNRAPLVDRIAREPFEKENRAIPVTKGETRYLEFVCCGKPLPEHDIRIVNEAGQEVLERVVGSLQFMGPSAMQGYYQNSEATKAIYHDGWWDTGDFAYMADNEVYITGRKKDLIIKAGRNIYPQEIEEVTGQVSGVRKGCVIAFGVNDPKWGTEKLVVVAETAEKKSSIQNQISAEIIDKISVVLGIPPDEVVLTTPRSIPKTSSGKLQRSLCKKFYLEGKLSRRGLPAWVQISKLYLIGAFIQLGRYLKKISLFFYTAYVGVLILIFLPIAWLILTVFPDARIARSLRYLLRFFFWISACRITTEGLLAIHNSKSLVFVANHASYVDGLLLMAFLPPNVAFVGKKELNQWPFVGKAFRKLKFLTVDRMDFSKNLVDTNQISKALLDGRSIMIFPEGTFTDAPGLRPFKLGAFKIATDTHASICPIALQGTRSLLRSGNWLLTRSPIKIIFGEPIVPLSKEWEEVTRLHALTRSFIEKNCGELTLDLVTAGLEQKKPTL